jgi:hypothetical protein
MDTPAKRKCRCGGQIVFNEPSVTTVEPSFDENGQIAECETICTLPKDDAMIEPRLFCRRCGKFHGMGTFA